MDFRSFSALAASVAVSSEVRVAAVAPVGLSVAVREVFGTFCFPTVENFGGSPINFTIQSSSLAMDRLRSRFVSPSSQIRQPSNVMFVSWSMTSLDPLCVSLTLQVFQHTKAQAL